MTAAMWTALGMTHCSAAHSSAHELDSVTAALDESIKDLLLQLNVDESDHCMSQVCIRLASHLYLNTTSAIALPFPF